MKIKPSKLTSDLQDLSIKGILKQYNHKPFSLRKLVKSTTLDLDPKERIVTEEYKQFMDKCRTIVQQKEYEDMTQEFKQEELDSMNQSHRFIASITNVLFSGIACFFAVFFMADAVQMNIGYRVLISLFFGFVVVFAEAWFFTKDFLL
ncbi:endoplasmic reticulum-based factor for assembly of V-ATPase-domain-containing protein [Gorgonomyces haynaldii]|nr:endoplasmic reticulum-based factor for assembly of V-ATPase-domain-containing protein [Gorgonomyces haynaldii]